MLLILISTLLGVCIGWCLCGAATKADNGGNWKDDLWWAAYGLIDLLGVLYAYHLGFLST